MSIELNRNVRQKLAQLEGNDIHDLASWDIRKRVLDRHLSGRQLNGLKLPWTKTHDKVRLRPGEVSIWAGFNAHNKSTLLSQVAAWSAHDTRVGIASLEMEMEDTANLMAMQTSGSAEPSKEWVNDFCEWTTNRIFIYDRLDTVPAAEMESAVDYMGDDLGCGLIVIDSLMMCGVADDMALERSFMNTLTGLAKTYQTHIAIAHHMRKPQHGDESYIPNKFDLRGSGGISDLAHSIFICWNNKALKELNNKRGMGIPLSPEEQLRYNKLKDRPEQLLIVAKQRHGAFEGGISLWQHPSRQFTASSQKQPLPFEIKRLAA